MSRGVCVVSGPCLPDCPPGKDTHYRLWFGGVFVMHSHNDDLEVTRIANALEAGAERLGINPDTPGCPPREKCPLREPCTTEALCAACHARQYPDACDHAEGDFIKDLCPRCSPEAGSR